MLRMPEFQVHLPNTPAEAVEMMSTLPNAMYIAGGTDLLPNLKHALHHPEHLVSLANLGEIQGVCSGEDGSLYIGAGTTLDTVANHPLVNEKLRGLAMAAASVAGPQHRHMGTIGGNVMLDTRCLYYNQSLQWRKALGYCLKKFHVDIDFG